jgi:hypothetical protein
MVDTASVRGAPTSKNYWLMTMVATKSFQFTCHIHRYVRRLRRFDKDGPLLQITKELGGDREVALHENCAISFFRQVFRELR